MWASAFPSVFHAANKSHAMIQTALTKEAERNFNTFNFPRIDKDGAQRAGTRTRWMNWGAVTFSRELLAVSVHSRDRFLTSTFLPVWATRQCQFCVEMWACQRSQATSLLCYHCDIEVAGIGDMRNHSLKATYCKDHWLTYPRFATVGWDIMMTKSLIYSRSACAKTCVKLDINAYAKSQSTNEANWGLHCNATYNIHWLILQKNENQNRQLWL